MDKDNQSLNSDSGPEIQPGEVVFGKFRIKRCIAYSKERAPDMILGEAHRYLGGLYRRKGDLVRAEQHLRESLVFYDKVPNVDPIYPYEANFQICVFYNIRKQPERAEEQFLEALTWIQKSH